MTQCNRIIEYCKNHKGITQKEASDDLGITRLASRINDLNRMGYSVTWEWESSKNRFGEPTHFKRYFVK